MLIFYYVKMIKIIKVNLKTMIIIISINVATKQNKKKSKLITKAN